MPLYNIILTIPLLFYLLYYVSLLSASLITTADEELCNNTSMPGSIFNIQPKTTIVVTTWIQEWSNPEFNTNMVPKDSTGNYVSNGDEDESEYYKIICYYTNFLQYTNGSKQFLPEDIDPSLCTHIIYGYVGSKNGYMTSSETNDESKDGMYDKLLALKKANPELIIMLSYGGWEYDIDIHDCKLIDIIDSKAKRMKFIDSAIALLRIHSFDGLEVNLEYSKEPNDSRVNEYLVLFLKELREKFEAEAKETNNLRLLLTAAFPVTPIYAKEGYDINVISSYLDFINLLTYDIHGDWETETGHNAPLYAPLYGLESSKQLSMDSAVNTWIQNGAPKNKIIIGVATYGRSFTLSNPKNNKVNSPVSGRGKPGKYTGIIGGLAYYEVCELLKNGATYVWDEEMKVPYVISGDQWIGFDDERSIKNKMQWIKDNVYGGVVVKSFDMDDFSGNFCKGIKYPLIGIIRDQLKGVKRDKNTIVNIEETTTTSTDKNVQSNQKMCYMQWSIESSDIKIITPENSDPSSCTHVIYSYGKIEDFKLTFSKEENEKWDKQLKILRQKNKNIKILLGIGRGASESSTFEQLTESTLIFQQFVKESTIFLRKYKFDGLDVNWSNLQSEVEKMNFVVLLKKLRESFEEESTMSGFPRLVLTAAVPPLNEESSTGYDVIEISKWVDFIDYNNIKITTTLKNKNDMRNNQKLCYIQWSTRSSDIEIITPENNDPSSCTHMIYSYGKIEDFKLSFSKEENEKWNEQLTVLRHENKNIKILLGIGKETSESTTFEELSESTLIFQRFVKESTTFLRRHKFDGLDVNWSNLQSEDEKSNYLVFLKKLRVSFEEESTIHGFPKLVLTSTVPHQYESSSTRNEVIEISKVVDFIDYNYSKITFTREKTTTLRDKNVRNNQKLCYIKRSITSSDVEIITPENNDPSSCTHMIYSYGKIKDFKLSFSKEENEKWNEQVTVLRQKNENIKILLGIGDEASESTTFEQLTENTLIIKRFVKESTIFLRKYKFDGLDVNWSNLRSEDEKSNFVVLLKKLRISFEEESIMYGPPKLILTAAVPPQSEASSAGYDVMEISKWVDFIDYNYIKIATTLKDKNVKSNQKMCYMQWSIKSSDIEIITAENNDPSSCTHMVYSYGKIKDFKLSFSKEENEKWDKQLTNLRQKNKNIKMLLRIGGASESTTFEQLTESTLISKRFVKESLTFLRRHKFDGLDVNWSNIRSEDEKMNFVVLLKKLRKCVEEESTTYGFPKLILTAAIPPQNEASSAGYDVIEISKWVDFVDYNYNKITIIQESTTTLKEENEQNNEIICYVNWSIMSSDVEIVTPENIDPLSCTHMIYSYGKIKDFKLSFSKEMDDKWDKILTILLQKNKNFKVFLAISGGAAESIIFEQLTKNISIYNSFVKEYTTFLRKHKFDGLDINWVNLRSEEEKSNFVVLLKKLRVSFEEDYIIYGFSRLLLTASVPPQNDILSVGYDVIEILKWVDFIDFNYNKIIIREEINENDKIAQPAQLICYMTTWSTMRPNIGKFKPENINPSLCTHIIYSFGKIINFKLTFANEKDNMWGKQLTDLRLKNKDLKVLLAVGGENSESILFQQLFGDKLILNRFVIESTKFLRKHKFDGLDVNWVHPNGEDEKVNFVNLLKNLRFYFEEDSTVNNLPRLLLTAAVPPQEKAISTGYDVVEISKYLDFINIMTYDFHGEWDRFLGHNSPLYPSQNSSVDEKKLTVEFSANDWVRRGAPKEKLLIGLPTYGRSFTLADPTKVYIGAPAVCAGNAGACTLEPGFMAYYEICRFLQSPITTLDWDSEQQVPFTYKNDQWISFDDTRSIKSKMSWLKKEGFGGVMVWAVDMDDFTGLCGNGKYPLINTIKQELSGYTVQYTNTQLSNL